MFDDTLGGNDFILSYSTGSFPGVSTIEIDIPDRGAICERYTSAYNLDLEVFLLKVLRLGLDSSCCQDKAPTVCFTQPYRSEVAESRPRDSSSSRE